MKERIHITVVQDELIIVVVKSPSPWMIVGDSPVWYFKVASATYIHRHLYHKQSAKK